MDRPVQFARRASHVKRVTFWRRFEQASIFAGELRNALIAHLERSAGGSKALLKQKAARFDQAQSLLVLAWAERGHILEVLVKSSEAHACCRRELLDCYSRSIVLPQN